MWSCATTDTAAYAQRSDVIEAWLHSLRGCPSLLKIKKTADQP